MELVSENKYRAYPKTSFNLIIAANITTPKYDVSLISYIGNTFLHDSIQLATWNIFPCTTRHKDVQNTIH